MARNSKKHLLVTGMRDLIVHRGLENVTADLLVDYVKMTKGGLFYHFRSVDQVVAAALADESDFTLADKTLLKTLRADFKSLSNEGKAKAQMILVGRLKP